MFKSLSAATQLFKRPCGLFKRHFRGCLRELRARNFGAMRFFTLHFFVLHSSLFVLQIKCKVNAEPSSLELC